VEELFRPIVVELHVAPARKEKRGGCEARQGDEADEQNKAEEVMADCRRTAKHGF